MLRRPLVLFAFLSLLDARPRSQPQGTFDKTAGKLFDPVFPELFHGVENLPSKSLLRIITSVPFVFRYVFRFRALHKCLRQPIKPLKRCYPG